MISDNFINILHDIKTPLNIIIGAIQLTEHNNDKNSENKIIQDKHFQAIKQNSYRLLQLVNSISDFIIAGNDGITFNPTICNIVSIVDELVQTSVPYAHHKGISLKFETTDREIVAPIDIEKFERIILNLLSNGIKFTPPGGEVIVKTSCLKNKALISVKDTGIGIPESKQDMIFKRFWATNPLSTISEGTGIGLSIVKYFVDLHKGKINFSSKEGEGSEFIVEIPAFNVSCLPGMSIK